jgi:hypothetical protein
LDTCLDKGVASLRHSRAVSKYCAVRVTQGHSEVVNEPAISEQQHQLSDAPEAYGCMASGKSVKIVLVMASGGKGNRRSRDFRTKLRDLKVASYLLSSSTYATHYSCPKLRVGLDVFLFAFFARSSRIEVLWRQFLELFSRSSSLNSSFAPRRQSTRNPNRLLVQAFLASPSPPLRASAPSPVASRKNAFPASSHFRSKPPSTWA